MINDINEISMGNRWVIDWLVIDYWRWSMSNRWLIDDQKFCGLSITYRCHWLFIDALLITHRLLIDYSSIIYWLLIDYTYIIMLHIYYDFPAFFFIITDFPVMTLNVNVRDDNYRQRGIVHARLNGESNWIHRIESKTRLSSITKHRPSMRIAKQHVEVAFISLFSIWHGLCSH